MLTRRNEGCGKMKSIHFLTKESQSVIGLSEEGGVRAVRSAPLILRTFQNASHELSYCDSPEFELQSCLLEIPLRSSGTNIN
jgi:hypothetical protein